MSAQIQSLFSRKKLHVALCLALSAPMGLGASAAWSQSDDGFEEAFLLDEIIVIGYRQSLQNASAFKRDSINITDSVFSEDVGKFPDLNIAEALNRVPGIQLSRENDGSGVNVAIRGLNTNFTKVTLNGSNIAVASSGKTDAINSNRELDLDVLPTEFFSRLDVSKSPVASMIEGGLSGTVNMRSLRPMDMPNNHLNYQAQMSYNELAEQVGPRGSLIGSWKNNERSFGILGGLAGVSNKVVTQGYESRGWTNANLTYDQCGVTPPDGTLPGSNVPQFASPGCAGNATGGNQFVIGLPVAMDPATGAPTGGATGFHVVPNNTQITGSSGTIYQAGDRIDQDFLLDVNPGLTIDQIGQGLIPRLGRPHYSEGNRDRVAAMVSMEWLPNDSGNYYLDLLYARAERDYDRVSMAMVGRNSALIPVNMQVDSNNIVTAADFYNAEFLLESRPYQETLNFYSINPGAKFFVGDYWTIDAQVNATRSDWIRESPLITLASNLNSGVAAQFDNTVGDYPRVLANIDLNDPNQTAGWNLVNAYVQNEERETETLGARLDFTFGEEHTNVKFGFAYDEMNRSIEGLDNWQWEGNVRSQISNAEIADYLTPGPNGHVTVDYRPFFEDTNYWQYSSAATRNTTSNTGAPTGTIDETTLAAYVEGNYATEVASRSLRLNGGLRAINTEQRVGGLRRSGNDFTFIEESSDYTRLLPSFNAAFELTDDLLLRTALSRTLTRANPAEMLPSVIFVDPSAQFANQGNPTLEPYTSDNFDIGLEWYFENEGYASINYFKKYIRGFTGNNVEQVEVNDLLDQIGINFDNLSLEQQRAINQRGGQSEATVGMVTPYTTDGKLDLQGVELLWVQPLPMVMEGLGYSINMTHVDQKPKGSGAPSFATEVSKNTVNATAYYENNELTLRLSYVWYDSQFGSGLGQDNIGTAQRFIDARGQWDFSASYEFMNLPTAPKVTLNLINFASDPQREIFNESNAAYRYYNPGFTAILGISGVLY